MIKVFSVAEMVAAEKAADAAGTTYDQMMETAGRAVAEAVIARYPVAKSTVTILVGPGNNGGDGLVAGRYLAQAGADVTFYLFKPRDPTDDPNLAKVQELGLLSLTAEFDQRYRVLRTRLNISDIVVDALLGTGVDRPISGELGKLMRQAQAGLAERIDILAARQEHLLTTVGQFWTDDAQDAKGESEDERPTFTRPVVVAVDCPSGLNCDTGELDAAAIPADLTVTFGGPKHGHFLFPGAAACGELVVADIDISPELPEVKNVTLELVTAALAAQLLPTRPRDGHKGTFGWVLIAAGSSRYWGAPAMAGRAAYRTGAGLVALAVPTAIRAALATQLPEATYPQVAETAALGAEAARALLADIDTYSALLVGPGLGEAAPFIETLLAADKLPRLIVDADGLNLLAAIPDWPSRLPAETVLTPHLGEMARLMGAELGEIKSQNRIALARKQAAAWDCVLVLKGAYTVVAAPDGRGAIIPFANPALATAGSGDVLSGIIVSLAGQGLDNYEAAVLGCFLHGAAGQAADVEAGLLAGEIADWIPDIWRTLRSG